MHICDLCGSESASVSAMLACVEQCETEAANTRDYFARYNPNHRD